MRSNLSLQKWRGGLQSKGLVQDQCLGVDEPGVSIIIDEPGLGYWWGSGSCLIVNPEKDKKI